jgi:hypothetical protein
LFVRERIYNPARGSGELTVGACSKLALDRGGSGRLSSTKRADVRPVKQPSSTCKAHHVSSLSILKSEEEDCSTDIDDGGK